MPMIKVAIYEALLVSMISLLIATLTNGLVIIFGWAWLDANFEFNKLVATVAITRTVIIRISN